MKTCDLLIKNGACLTPAGRQSIDIAVTKGKIVAIGPLVRVAAETVIDASNLHVLPGVIDSQVHFREPGNEHKEDLESGTRAAVLGGVTAIFEMPNTSPPTTSAAALTDKLQRMQGRGWCNYAFFVGGTPEIGVDWASLERLPGCCGIKIFMGSSTGNLLVSEDEAIREILSNSRRRCAVHSEDEARLNERYAIAEAGQDPSFHPIWRDETVAFNSTQRLLRIATETKHPVHVLHITTEQEMTLLAEHKHLASVEVLPQHLTFCDEDYAELGTYLQMNPPIRAAKHREALWRAIDQGIVDVIGSDHAPHTREEKSQTYPKSPSGMPGVQTLVPVMLDHVSAGRLSLERLVDLVCTGPARVYNIAGKGRIAVGYDADFTLVDLGAQRTIDNQWIASKCGWTPYHNKKVTGWPTHTIIRGHIVMQEDELRGEPLGQAVDFIV